MPLLHTILSTLALTSTSLAAGLYSSPSSAVFEITPNNYQTILHSNHSTIVEFYAPWCGHCQNLKPAYEKAAKQLAGLARVAAVNCDDETLKPFCAQYGIQGFPTLKLVRPGKKPGKPSVSDYQGGRDVKSIVTAVLDAQPNHVKRLRDADLASWIEHDTLPAGKILLFSAKPTVAPLFKALATDYLGSLAFGFVAGNKEPAATQQFGVQSFPAIVYVSHRASAESAHEKRDGGESHSSSSSSEGSTSTYGGAVNREDIVAWIKEQTGLEPNPDPNPNSTPAAAAAARKKAKKSSVKGGGRSESKTRKEKGSAAKKFTGTSGSKRDVKAETAVVTETADDANSEIRDEL